jgi:L-ascorbate metabolism protein UlaG (beta-lactamase superfamily)
MTWHRLFWIVGAMVISGCRDSAETSIETVLALEPPDLSPYAAYELEHADEGRLLVSFLGVATLLFDDGETAIMTDGYFTRINREQMNLDEPIAPDQALVAAGLKRIGVDRLAAVMTVHSHFDHSLDTPVVAQLTGATVVGSRSTANIARGWGLDEDQIKEVESGDSIRFGDFEVTFIRSKHYAFPGASASSIGKEILSPLVPPQPRSAYVEGGSYSILIEHPEKSFLVQGSAGSLPGALDAYSTDVVLLGIGGLGLKERDYKEGYWRDVVEALDAKVVIPIHFDDLTRPATAPLEAIPDVPQAFDFLIEKAGEANIEFALLPYYLPADLSRSRNSSASTNR